MMRTVIAASAMLAFAGSAQAQDDMTMDSHALSTAIGGYPACSANVQDSCVQMGEAEAYAGTGGPFEPVEQHADARIDISAHHGMGGPLEEDYPPCDPGPGDDNCIQLYERGVSP